MASTIADLAERLKVKLVKSQILEPEPAEFPPLLPTLQTWLGMVTRDGHSQVRNPYCPPLSETEMKVSKEKTVVLRSLPSASAGRRIIKDKENRVEANLQACTYPTTKDDLLAYIRHGKRLDTEQVVAMVIAHLVHSAPEIRTLEDSKTADDFEADGTSAIQELLNDGGVVDMITNTCMWREQKDYVLLDDPRELCVAQKKKKILRSLGYDAQHDMYSNTEFIQMLQTLRRKRNKMNDSQYLTFPPDMIPGDDYQKKPWTTDKSYRLGRQESISHDQVQVKVIPRRRFRRIQRLLYSMLPPWDVTSRYVLDVENLIKTSGATSAPRMAALEATDDAYALAYGFTAAQRARQLKVVSDLRWTRFLVKGESSMILQNRPDILTSFEDVLVRHAHDLRALSAVRCPKGVRDHFSTQQEIKTRARAVCELMERYVRDFGSGDMHKLTFSRETRGGSGRGPIDKYNALCDELRDCSGRAKAVGMDLDIAPVHKFLAKDIMSRNKSWGDDAFAGDKVPGWIEYLARVRAEEMSLDDTPEK